LKRLRQNTFSNGESVYKTIIFSSPESFFSPHAMALCSFKNDSLILSIDCSFMLFTSYIFSSSSSFLYFFFGFCSTNRETQQTFSSSPRFFSERQAQLETVEKVRKKLLDCRNVNKLESRFRGGKPVPFAKQTSFGRHKNGNLFSL
jgi:hypothetical protein